MQPEQVDSPTSSPFIVTARGGAGLTAAQVRHPRYLAPSRGVRLPDIVDDLPRSLAAAALLVAPDGAILCDVAAARDWDLPLPPSLGLRAAEVPVGIAVAPESVRPRRRGVRGRRLDLPAAHVVERGGLRVTSPARTWLDCAELLRVEHVVAMGDVVLRRGLGSRDELFTMIRWGRGRRGVVTARRAFPMLDPRAESPPESVVRCHLLLGGIPRPVCNMDVIVDGEWLARVDLAWPDERVIVEYDGAVHGSERARRADAARRNLLQDAGWLVIVLTARDLSRPDDAVALVRSALRARKPR